MKIQIVIIILMIAMPLSGEALCEQYTYINQPLIFSVEEPGQPPVPFNCYRVTRDLCRTYLTDANNNPSSVLDTPKDAVVTYYHSWNRERILFIVDFSFDRIVCSNQRYLENPDPIWESELFAYGEKGVGVGEFRLPRGIDATSNPTGGFSGLSGEFGSDANDIHVFVSELRNQRISWLLYRRDEDGGHIIPNNFHPHIYHNEFMTIIDVTCDPWYWNIWDVIYVLDERGYIIPRDLNNLNDLGVGGLKHNIFGSCGIGPGEFKNPTSLCVRKTHMVVADAGNHRVELLLCSENNITWVDDYYFPEDSYLTSVSIDQFDDVYVTDAKRNRIHKLHIDDEGDGKLVYLNSFGCTGSDPEQFLHLKCVAAGIKEDVWNHTSDLVVVEDWSEDNGVVGYIEGADIIDFEKTTVDSDPEDEYLEIELEFTNTGPIEIHEMEVLASGNNWPEIFWDDQWVTEITDENLSESGHNTLQVRLGTLCTVMHDYSLRIRYSSLSESFTTGERVVSNRTVTFPFESGFYTDAPAAPVLSDPYVSFNNHISLEWNAPQDAQYCEMRYKINDGGYCDAGRTQVDRYSIYHVKYGDTYTFQARSVNNCIFGVDRGYSDWSNEVSALVEFPDDHSISLVQGWNWVSSYLKPMYCFPELAEVPFCVQDIDEQQLYVVKNGAGQSYTPDPYSNNIDRWEFTEGYLVKVLDANQTMIMRGEEIDYETPIELDIGWSYIPYFMQSPVDCEVALESLLDPDPQFNLLKDQYGHFFSPEFQFNNIGDMEIGYAYQIDMTEEGTLIYNDPGIAAAMTSGAGRSIEINKDPAYTDTPEHYEFTRTDFFFPILVSDIRVRNYQPSVGDEIAAFTRDNVCVGAARFNGEFPFGLAIWRDDTTTREIDGYRNLEEVRYRYWVPRFDREVAFDSLGSVRTSSTIRTSTNSNEKILEVRDFTCSDGLIPMEFFLDQNYPNPFNSYTEFKYGLPDNAHASLKIFDTMGREVIEVFSENKQAGYYTSIWDGKDKSGKPISSGLYLYQLRAGDYKQVRKMTIIK